MRLPSRRLRIPVRYVQGTWENELGGVVPVEEGTLGELLIESRRITDETFAELMDRRGRHKVLPEGTTLLVGLNVQPGERPTKEQRAFLKRFVDLQDRIPTAQLGTLNLDGLCFVEVRISKPSASQVRRFDDGQGGLWLVTQGLEAVGLISTAIRLPDGLSHRQARSLNHAYTMLSEIYEPERISHTGNVYRRVLYREADGKWYPLELLRNRTLQQEEQKIAGGLWAEFMAKMTRANPSVT